MRVLPGMQSAFVDIGLERDALSLCLQTMKKRVERIVMDKSKKGEADDAQRIATKRPRRVESASTF